MCLLQTLVGPKASFWTWLQTSLLSLRAIGCSCEFHVNFWVPNSKKWRWKISAHEFWWSVQLGDYGFLFCFQVDFFRETSMDYYVSSMIGGGGGTFIFDSYINILMYVSHSIHVWYIYLHLPLKKKLNVGKYTIHGWYGYSCIGLSVYWVLPNDIYFDWIMT